MGPHVLTRGKHRSQTCAAQPNFLLQWGKTFSRVERTRCVTVLGLGLKCFNGATRSHAWKGLWPRLINLTVSSLQWGHTFSRVERRTSAKLTKQRCSLQ